MRAERSLATIVVAILALIAVACSAAEVEENAALDDTSARLLEYLEKSEEGLAMRLPGRYESRWDSSESVWESEERRIWEERTATGPIFVDDPNMRTRRLASADEGASAMRWMVVGGVVVMCSWIVIRRTRRFDKQSEAGETSVDD